MVNETRLVYPGAAETIGNWTPQGLVYEDVDFQACDGTRLHGWFLPRSESNATSQPQIGPNATAGSLQETILLCHGNAENVAMASAYIGDRMRTTLNANVFVFDYRGFGKSQGVPSEPGLIDDAESALAWLCQRTGKTPAEIIIVGHSIGGGPACHLAATKGCKLLILQRTFDSLAGTAQYNYPMFPVRYVMQNQFDSAYRIMDYHGPVFQSHGQADRLIPIELARNLFDSVPGENKQFLDIPGMGHYDALPESYWTDLRRFVESINQP